MEILTAEVLSLFYDDHFVRYRLVKKNINPHHSYNWIFLPGGPGADSCYYLSLIHELDDLGNFWLIDFPENGDNRQADIDKEYNFDLWQNYFIPALQRFERPILVGQSFGGMFPLLFPQLENILSGFIILSSASKLWFNEATEHARKNNISMVSEAGVKFRENPSQETFKAALLDNAHRHFPETSINIGKEMFEQLPFNYKAMLWWLKKVQDIDFNAQWIPQSVPTLIMGGTQDFVIPASIFENDLRFHRNNIEIRTLEEAGHFLWIDQMSQVKKAFNSFYKRLLNIQKHSI